MSLHDRQQFSFRSIQALGLTALRQRPGHAERERSSTGNTACSGFRQAVYERLAQIPFTMMR